jgi:hypothetical protein
MQARKVLRTSGAVITLAIAFAAPAHAQVPCVPAAGVGACPTPTPTPAPPAPDPGGQENPAVPPVTKPFGTNGGYPTLSGPITDAAKAESLQAFKDIGATMFRTGIGIKWLYPTAETPITANMQKPLGQAPENSFVDLIDEMYLELLAEGITPVLAFYSVPDWASTLHRCSEALYKLQHSAECPDGWNDINRSHHYPAPEFYGVWKQWIAWAAARYPQGIIEGPNEPDWVWTYHQANPKTFPWGVTPEVAAQIQCQAYQAAHSVSSRPYGSMALGGGTGGNATYLAAYVPAAKNCYDFFSFHPYPYGTSAGNAMFLGAGSGFAERFNRLRTARSKAGDTKPIWVTETGYHYTPTGNATTDANNEQLYADATRRLYNRLATMPDVAAVLLHTLRDNPSNGDANERYWGLYRYDWTPKPRACYFVSIFGQTRLGC